VQGQAGPSWQDGADIGIPTYTVVRFLGRVQGERKFLLVTMAALFGSAGSFEYQRLPRSQGTLADTVSFVCGTLLTTTFFGLNETGKRNSAGSSEKLRRSGAACRLPAAPTNRQDG
jgi:hypothetical protein